MGNVALVLAYYFYNRNRANWHLVQRDEQCIQQINATFHGEDAEIDQIVGDLRLITAKTMNLHLDDVDELFIHLYLRSVKKETNSQNIRCIILSHGYSTASGIASVINNLFNEHVMDAIDMPLDIDVAEIGEKVSSYVKNRQINRGLILMVDMGSLEAFKNSLAVRLIFQLPLLTMSQLSQRC